MAFKFPSDEWIKELKNQININDAYERLAKDWEGDFIFVIEPDGVYPEETYLFLGLYHGKCTDAAMMGSQSERKAQFYLRAPFTNWRKVIEGTMDPMMGMMTRKIKLKGDMMKIVRYRGATQEMVNCVSQVRSDFGS